MGRFGAFKETVWGLFTVFAGLAVIVGIFGGMAAAIMGFLGPGE